MSGLFFNLLVNHIITKKSCLLLKTAKCSDGKSSSCQHLAPDMNVKVTYSKPKIQTMMLFVTTSSVYLIQ